MFNIAKTLHKKSSREEHGLFLIEGRREIELAEKHGIEIIHVFDKTNTSVKNLERISYCGETVAVAKTPARDLHGFSPPENPLIIILDNLEKPGNIGAILRTSDAAGVSAVLICDDKKGGCGDPDNPNLIRASLGAVFCLPVFPVSSSQACDWLNRHNIPIVTASPDASKHYYEYDYSPPVAVVVGSESSGISGFWMSKTGDSVTIPMNGEVNSLNVSVSAAIIIYQAVKDRPAAK